METGKLTKYGKIALLSALAINATSTVNAAPLGSSEMTLSSYYWIIVSALIALLAVFYVWNRNTEADPIEVQGLTYDKTNHQLELTVKNTSNQEYSIKSALRLINPQLMPQSEAAEEGALPMAKAQAAPGRTLYQLLAEDELPVKIGSNETKTLSYNVMLPKQYIELSSAHNVEVHINYGDEDEAGKPINLKGEEDLETPMKITPFKLRDNEKVLSEVSLVEDLAKAVSEAPVSAVAFHLRDGNDFADWVEHAAEDGNLAEKLRNAARATDDILEAKDLLSKTIDVHLKYQNQQEK
ncbi:MAG: hypothetical protein GF334_02780 [Candidatus Altiarchaeales archaeon]|nr:hypothetical protein [Candidatus Altiarchaeales archaeon]